MNIHDLQPGSYQVESQGSGAPLNVKNLAPGSFTIDTPPAAPDTSFGGRVQADVAKRGQQMTGTISRAASGQQGDFSTGYQVGGQGAGLIADVAGEVVKSVPGVQTATEQASKIPGLLSPEFQGARDALKMVPEPIKQAASSAWESLKSSLGSAYDELVKKHPEAMANIQATIDAGRLAGTVVAGKQLAEDVVKLPKTIKETLTPKPLTEAEKLAKIQETISPKPTVKEAKLAQKEGRLVKGKPETLFKSSTADEILPSDKMLKAQKTILENIPGSEKMNESELYSALEQKTTEMAQNLKPEMEKVQVKSKTIENVNSEWEKLKKTQVEGADATEEANVKKLQTQFESRLKKLESRGATLDDYWQARKDYDASVPENVKKANQMSSETLQNKRQIWLDNRKILNNAINDSESGMGKTSRKAFSDMHDMYNAQEGINSKAKVETAIKPSKAAQLIKKHPVITGAVVGGAASATGIPGKLIHSVLP